MAKRRRRPCGDGQLQSRQSRPFLVDRGDNVRLREELDGNIVEPAINRLPGGHGLPGGRGLCTATTWRGSLIAHTARQRATQGHQSKRCQQVANPSHLFSLLAVPEGVFRRFEGKLLST